MLLFTSKKLWTFRYIASGLLISSIIICEEGASLTAAEQFLEESGMKRYNNIGFKVHR
jgi:hypothetical protein